MSKYRNVPIKWLQDMYDAGYIALCDADYQEVIDVVWEGDE